MINEVGAVSVAPCSPDDPALVALVTEQQREIIEAEGPGAVVFALHDGITFVLARVDGRPVGCGALQPLGDGYGEVKRMYTAPAWRGRGLARHVLSTLERLAVEAGWHTLRLETGRDMPAAVALYTAAGFREIPNFGHYVGYPASLCMEKPLG